MGKCDRCSKEGKIFLVYGPHYFCHSHFLEFFEKRVRKTINKFRLVKPGEKIAIGVSGGKDSITVLHLLREIFPKGTELRPVCIDEGIPGYRDKALRIAKKHFQELGLDCTIISMKKELGFSMLEIAKKLGKEKEKQETQGACSYCGVFRRKLLNDFAVSERCNKLATGHNLDDEAQTILMNQFRRNISASARLGPITGVIQDERFIRRIKPLYFLTEREIAAFAFLNNLKDEYVECPNAAVSYRCNLRDWLNEIEAKYPGTKHSIVNSFMEIQPILRKRLDLKKIKTCKICAEPCSQDICQACKLADKLKLLN